MSRLALFSFLAIFLLAGALLSPLAAQSTLLQGGTIHLPGGETLEGSVLIADGLIQEVGDVQGSADATVDISGLHVYPGMFNAYTTLGLVEISSISATVDNEELGAYSPHLQSATAIHPASEVIPVTRANGITHSLVAPGGGVISGQAALIHLDGWTVEEMALDVGAGMVMQWPAIQTSRFDFATFSVKTAPYKEAKEKAEKQVEEIRDWLEAARHYQQATEGGSERIERNLKLEHLVDVLDRGQLVIVVANGKRDIEAAIEFADEEGLRIAIAGGRDAHKVKETLAEKEIPVILGLVGSLPPNEDDPYDRAYSTMGELVEAGVKVAMGTSAPSGGGGGPGGPHGARTLPYEVAMAVGYGLSRADAIDVLTKNPAEIFGVEDKIGSIEAGKIANLIVTDGDPLEIMTRVKHVFIGGRDTGLDNKHDALYEKYRARGSR